MLIRLIVCAVVMFLLGCATVDDKSYSCTNQDWYAVGLQTATDGKSVRTFDQYSASCGSQLKSGAKDAYLDGYTKGIIAFCSQENGFALGVKNLPKATVCPAEMQQLYNKGYAMGLREYKDKMHGMKNLVDQDERLGTEVDLTKDKSESGH